MNPRIILPRLVRTSRLACSILLAVGASIIATPAKAALPAGFAEENIGSGWNEPVGMVFGKNAAGTKDRIYIWERAGKVWIVEDGVKLPTPLIDLSEEVGGWRDFGLLGFALDPNFQQNGRIYLCYVVDRHHLLYHGTPQYNPNSNEYFAATIGRITRYTARASDDFRSVDPASRQVLLGESVSTGFPILHQSHGTGHLVFGRDGTLLATCGDGASYSATDTGGNAGGSYGTQAVQTGIITSAENIGAYRSQSVDSLSGKVIRIDPNTGNGVPGNPYYNSNSPRSARSRLYALGLRNPYRFSVKPGTGSTNPADGNPGVLYIGDVGWNSAEELNICTVKGQNFGWPLYEGNSQRSDYWNPRPSGMPFVAVTKPAMYWRGSAYAIVNGTAYQMGATNNPVSGPNFSGNASTGGVWYQGTDFPPEWRNTYFQADYGGEWIKAIDFDANHTPTRVRNFYTGGPVVFLATHPERGGLYYINWGQTPKRIFNTTANTAPVAAATSDVRYGPGPLTVNFDGRSSTDPENQALTYQWNFGDGTPNGTGAQVSHTFQSPDGTPRRFDVQLTVTDPLGLSSSTTIPIWVNNTPPVVEITSPERDARYPITEGDIIYPLDAEISDAEHSSGFTYAWETILHHNEHAHTEPIDHNFPSSVVISATHDSDTDSYYFEIRLTVTDPLGLSATDSINLYPNAAPVAVNDTVDVAPKSSAIIDVLANDIDDTPLNPSSVTIVSEPSHGSVFIDPDTGEIIYEHRGGSAATDSFTYRVSDDYDTESNVATVTINIQRSFAAFQAGRPGAGESPTSNNDGDQYNDLLEFALGGDPASGASTKIGLDVLTTNKAVHVVFTRPVGLTGVTYALETSGDLRTWLPANINPTVTGIGGGLQKVRFGRVDLAPGVSNAAGFARLRVTVAGAGEAVTQPVGWLRTTFHKGEQTHGLPLVKKAAFSGRVAAVFGNTLYCIAPGLESALNKTKKYYAEVTTGAYEGHRFEVSPVSSFGSALVFIPGSATNTLASLPTDLAGSDLIVREHQTLRLAYPPAQFAGGANPDKADQIRFFNGSTYDVYYLYRNPAGVKWWALAGDPSRARQDHRVIQPGEGAIVYRRGAVARLHTATGEVRQNEFLQPLRAGTTLVASGFPVVTSPVARGLTFDAGFPGGINPAATDNLQFLNADNVPGAGGTTDYFHLDAGGDHRFWAEVGDSEQWNYDYVGLFAPNRSAFVHLRNGAFPDYTVPLPWTQPAPETGPRPGPGDLPPPPPPPPGPDARFADNFDDNALDASKWRLGTFFGLLFNPNAADPEIQVVEQNARLEITPRIGVSGDRYRGAITLQGYDLTGAAGSVHVVQPAGGASDTFLGLCVDSMNFLVIGREAGLMWFEQTVGGSREYFLIAYNPDRDRHWRIRHDAATDRIHYETSPDGQTWTSHHSKPRRIPITSLHVELTSGTWQPEGDVGKAIFDDVKIAVP